MRPISFLGSEELNEWDNEEVKRLADYYGTRQTHTHEGKTTVSEPMVDPDKLVVHFQYLVHRIECEMSLQIVKFHLKKI